MNTKLVVLTGLCVLLASAAGRAHHSFGAEFDANKPLKVTGTVTKLEWMNPHAWFYLDVKDETGKVTNWVMEMGSPNGLMRAGRTRHSMKPGDVVSVEGFRSRSGSRAATSATWTSRS